MVNLTVRIAYIGDTEPGNKTENSETTGTTKSAPH